MVKEKKDIISNTEFTKIYSRPKKGHRIPIKNETAHDDENKDALEETLIGMEYDVDSDEEEEWPKEYSKEEKEELEEEIENPNDPRRDSLL